MATAVIGMLLLAVAIGFVVSATGRLLDPDTVPTPSWITLWPALIAVVAKEALFHYTRRAARQVRSALVEANAWHHRSDALSSVVVIGGIIGALLGAPWLDTLAGILVAGMIGHMGRDFVWKALQEVVDTGLDDDEIRELRERIMSVPGVLSTTSFAPGGWGRGSWWTCTSRWPATSACARATASPRRSGASCWSTMTTCVT